MNAMSRQSNNSEWRIPKQACNSCICLFPTAPDHGLITSRPTDIQGARKRGQTGKAVTQERAARASCRTCSGMPYFLAHPYPKNAPASHPIVISRPREWREEKKSGSPLPIQSSCIHISAFMLRDREAQYMRKSRNTWC